MRYLLLGWWYFPLCCSLKNQIIFTSIKVDGICCHKRFYAPNLPTPEGVSLYYCIFETNNAVLGSKMTRLLNKTLAKALGRKLSKGDMFKPKQLYYYHRIYI